MERPLIVNELTGLISFQYPQPESNSGYEPRSGEIHTVQVDKHDNNCFIITLKNTDGVAGKYRSFSSDRMCAVKNIV